MSEKTLYASTKEIIQLDILGIDFVIGGPGVPTYFRWPEEKHIEIEEISCIEYLPNEAKTIKEGKPLPDRMLDSYPKIDRTTSLFTWRELIETRLVDWAYAHLTSDFEEDGDALGE